MNISLWLHRFFNWNFITRLASAIGFSHSFQKRNKAQNRTINNLPILTQYAPLECKRDCELYSLQRQCIRDFCQSDEGLSIDSNFSKLVKVAADNTIQQHMQQVYVANTMPKIYSNFKESRVVK